MAARRTSALRTPLALACFLLTAAVGVALDQWSKIYAFATLGDTPWWNGSGKVQVASRVYEFIPGWLHFEVTANQGAVFGMGQGQRTLFILVSCAAILFLCYLFAVSGRQHFYQIILGMLLAGVIGNLYDRIRFQYVRDMIHALPRWGIFPYIFNVADSLLCVGVGLMILHSFLHPSLQDEEKGKNIFGDDDSARMSITHVLFSFKGRIPRSTFWAFIIGVFFAFMIGEALLYKLFPGPHGTIVLILFFTVACCGVVVLVWAVLAVSVKRWHDRGISGWAVLINLIPFIGFFIALHQTGFLPGDSGPNKYGPDPLGRERKGP